MDSSFLSYNSKYIKPEDQVNYTSLKANTSDAVCDAISDNTDNKSFFRRIRWISKRNTAWVPDRKELKNLKYKKRIADIIIELLQNVVKNQSIPYAKKSKFIMREDGGELHFYISNYLDTIVDWKNKVDEIKSRIDEINTMGYKKLKEIYLERFDNWEVTASSSSWEGWWWLWFIRNAMKIRAFNKESTKHIFNYEFEPTEYNNISKYTVRIKIPIEYKQAEASS